MKHILFTIHYLELGGAERSLIGLLHALDYSKVNVDLFVYSHRGELMKEIPSQVNLLPEIPQYAQIERPLAAVLRDGYLRIVFTRLRAKWQFARYRRKHHPRDGGAIFAYVAKNVTPQLPPINPDKEYDLAVSFLAPHDIVLEKVRAKKKACWVHTDYTKVDVNPELELPVWGRYDHIAAVSDAVSDAFLTRFPSLRDKMVTIPNILSPEWVRTQADAFCVDEEMPREPGVTRLLSIGRFTEAKNFDNVPDICRRIREKGVDVRWYLIGYGGDEGLIRQRIAESDMVDYVRILGKRTNPYPYMKACDIYVQPSRYEGSPVTIREAIALGKPVVATAFPTVQSAIQDRVDGFIVPMDNEGCAERLARFIQDSGSTVLPEYSRIDNDHPLSLMQFNLLLQMNSPHDNDCPLISVIVPLYNQQRHIRQCLRSIQRQTYHNLEILVVNDGSTDRSAEIVQGLTASDRRIQVINQKNGGVASARKRGYQEASGKWIVFVDSDDFLTEDCIGTLYHAALEHQVDVVCCNYFRKWGLMKKSYRAFPCDMAMKEIRQPELFSSYYLSFFGVNLFPVTMYGKIYRKSLIDMVMGKVDLFLTPRLHMGEDEAFNLLLFPFVSSVFFLEKSFYIYRYGGLTSGYNPCFVELLGFCDYRLGLLDYYHYDAGYSTLFIEYVNIIVSHIQQNILLGKWNRDDAKEWVYHELDNRYLIQRMLDYYSQRPVIPDKCLMILNRDIDKIIGLAEIQMKQVLFRAVVKRVLAKVSK